MAEVIFPLKGKRVWVAGHKGMVGSAIVRRLAAEDCEILTVDRTEVDLRDLLFTWKWVRDHRPDAIFVAAAKVGGILANSQSPATFLFDNLAIAASVIGTAAKAEVPKLLFLGSSCIYPKFATQPIVEEALLSGYLEPTNEAYAIAKIAGLKLCQAYRKQYGCDFISAMPCNLYGPGDNYDLETSHFVPALIRKAHEVKTSGGDLIVWGSGNPRRELMHVDDCADALVHLMKVYSEDMHINVGRGIDTPIGALAEAISVMICPDSRIVYDRSKPDGTPRKCMDVSRMTALGWEATIGYEAGLASAYADFLERYS